jgi:hypothetical protein
MNVSAPATVVLDSYATVGANAIRGYCHTKWEWEREQTLSKEQKARNEQEAKEMQDAALNGTPLKADPQKKRTPKTPGSAAESAGVAEGSLEEAALELMQARKRRCTAGTAEYEDERVDRELRMQEMAKEQQVRASEAEAAKKAAEAQIAQSNTMQSMAAW